MTAHFDMNNKIEMLDIVMLNHTEYLPRSQLQALEQAAAELPKQSPKVTKNSGKRGQQKQPPPPAATLPESMVTLNGVPGAVMQFMEVCFTPQHPPGYTDIFHDVGLGDDRIYAILDAVLPAKPSIDTVGIVAQPGEFDAEPSS